MHNEEPSAPKVSVLMTLYDKGPFVEAAVRSVLEGTYADIEVLVVDDASTDDGPARVQAIGDPRVRLLRAARNGGRASAANRGYEAARGTYIAVLDADDLAAPERIAEQVAFMDTHPEVGVCGSAARSFGVYDAVSHWPLTDEECRGRMFFSDPVLYGTSMLRCSVLREHGLRSDPSWLLPAEDYLFLLKWAQHTGFANLSSVLTHYRIGEQNQRHGRDPVSDRAAVCRAVFTWFGISAGEEQLRLHLLLYKLSRVPITRADIVALDQWRIGLLRMNAQRGLFPPVHFARELQRLWSGVFHLAADAGVVPAWTHMMRCEEERGTRLLYLIKVTLRRWFGRAR
ncbi:MAG: glycosyltransferase family 2 protein [Flavobacteriales bacterium]|nr:glycosyltransferase family 2 protein [Flavobacteriales bacterium]